MTLADRCNMQQMSMLPFTLCERSCRLLATRISSARIHELFEAGEVQGALVLVQGIRVPRLAASTSPAVHPVALRGAMGAEDFNFLSSKSIAGLRCSLRQGLTHRKPGLVIMRMQPASLEPTWQKHGQASIRTGYQSTQTARCSLSPSKCTHACRAL